MKARVLKRILNDTGYIVHETEKHVCVGSPLCSELISLQKDNMQLRYALDTFHKGKESIRTPELVQIWEKLEGMIASGEIKALIESDDTIENPLPVFSHDHFFNIIKTFTDEYGWPNTTISGRLMYDSTWFKTEAEAIKRAHEQCQSGIEWREERLDELHTEIASMEQVVIEYKEAKKRLEGLL